MAYFISPEEFNQYKADIDGFMNQDSALHVFTWRRAIRRIDTAGSDDKPLFKDVEMQGLFQDNHFRSWPINADTITGQIDKESVLLFLNDEYLKTNGWLNEHGEFKFKPSSDRFIWKGVTYIPKGESSAAQIHNQTLLHFIVLSRDHINTPEDRY